MSFLPDLLRDLAGAGVAAISGVNAQAAAFFASRIPDLNRLVIITPDDQSAASFAGDLSLFLGGTRTYLLPPVESSPYEMMTPDRESAAQRICALTALKLGLGPVVLSSTVLLQPTPPPEKLAAWSLELDPGREVDRDDLVRKLARMGYQREAVATQTGEMAVRGGILDIFPPAFDLPVRVELWEDRIYSLRSYDPQSQRSGDSLAGCTVLPVTETLLTPIERETSCDLLSEGFSAA
jgi:transcription-repair coupling factor (superfamily II helicase)